MSSRLLGLSVWLGTVIAAGRPLDVLIMNKPDARAEDKLDEALEETFPASDPPANTVETGIGLGLPRNRHAHVTDNRAAQRLELDINGEVEDYLRKHPGS